MANPVVVANPVNPDEIIVFGGTSLYNSTSKLFQHFPLLLLNELPKLVYMGKQLLWSDMHAFNVATSTWRKIDYNTSGSSVVPPGMVYHKGIVVGTDLHIFGGKVCPDGDYSLCPSDPQPLNISYRFVRPFLAIFCPSFFHCFFFCCLDSTLFLQRGRICL